MRKVFGYCLLFFLISSCRKDEKVDLPTAKGVYIINEGNFNFGNSEISFSDPQTNEIINNLFQSSNSYSLGDVAQSMYIRDSTGFIVVNNSSKIEVVRIPSLKKIRTITISGSAPRYFYPVNDSIAYVTELYAKKVWIVNYLAGAVVTTITTEGWSENILQIDDYLFVEQRKLSTLPSAFAALLKINLSSNTITGTKTFGERDVSGIAKDKFGRVWVAVDEDSVNNQYAGFYCFNKNLTDIKSLFFSTYNHHPTHLQIDSKGEKLAYIDRDIFNFSIEDQNVPVDPLIAADGKNIYTFGIDPGTDDIYLSDGLDYVQQSRIYRYDKNGTLLHSFTAGVISGNFSFSND